MSLGAPSIGGSIGHVGERTPDAQPKAAPSAGLLQQPARLSALAATFASTSSTLQQRANERLRAHAENAALARDAMRIGALNSTLQQLQNWTVTGGQASSRPSLLASTFYYSEGERGGAELMAEAAQQMPLMLQLLVPILLLLSVVGLFLFVAYAFDCRPGRMATAANARTHRRMPSGEEAFGGAGNNRGVKGGGEPVCTSPRRGFSYSASWSNSLAQAEEGGALQQLPPAVCGGDQAVERRGSSSRGGDSCRNSDAAG